MIREEAKNYISALVEKALMLGASDIHILYGLPAKCRIDGEIRNIDEEIMTAEDCEAIARALAGARYEEMALIGELDLAETIADARCRIHLFRQQGVPSLALRTLSDRIPALDRLGLPPGAMGLTDLHKGIILVTGETGAGKSTTLAAMLDRINHTRSGHIVTLEDPVEYLYTPDKCIISQREVGRDTRSFAEGLRASLREDPDVILIGEMRDRDTIETAITAAETGHLVFATLHTNSASDAIDRIVQVFPEGAQNQIRMQLSLTLEAVLSQQLIKKSTGGRALACELMLVTDSIRNLIRCGDTPQIANMIATSASIGGQTMDQSLLRLYERGLITKEMALHYAKDRDYIKRNFF